ncbi:MAG TPA: histidinol-phosphate transaminase [Bacteroidetes bacterium]|nr:histidinol-phosphate transaminase [Bacteroidota bacterium]
MRDFTRVFKRAVRETPGYSLPRVSYRIKLNQNENPFPVPEEVRKEILGAIASRDWNRYPELGSGTLRRTLGDWLGVAPEQVLVGNGSNEILLAIFQSVLEPGKTLLTLSPTFSLYRHYGEIFGAKVIEVPLDGEFRFPAGQLLAAIREAQPELVVLCSPNNPTGTALEEPVLVSLLEESPGLVIVDEAYHLFGGQDFLPLTQRYPNLVLTRSFSKAFAFAFGRFGFAVGAAEVLEQVAKVLLPYNLSGFTEAVVDVLVRRWPLLQQSVQEIVRERELLYRALQGLPGVRVFPSAANFLLIRPEMDAEQLFWRLVREHGILVRNVSGYPGLGNHLRISVGTPAENAELLKALRAVLAGSGADQRAAKVADGNARND